MKTCRSIQILAALVFLCFGVTCQGYAPMVVAPTAPRASPLFGIKVVPAAAASPTLEPVGTCTELAASIREQWLTAMEEELTAEYANKLDLIDREIAACAAKDARRSSGGCGGSSSGSSAPYAAVGCSGSYSGRSDDDWPDQGDLQVDGDGDYGSDLPGYGEYSGTNNQVLGVVSSRSRRPTRSSRSISRIPSSRG